MAPRCRLGRYPAGALGLLLLLAAPGPAPAQLGSGDTWTGAGPLAAVPAPPQAVPPAQPAADPGTRILALLSDYVWLRDRADYESDDRVLVFFRGGPDPARREREAWARRATAALAREPKTLAAGLGTSPYPAALLKAMVALDDPPRRVAIKDAVTGQAEALPSLDRASLLAALAAAPAGPPAPDPAAAARHRAEVVRLTGEIAADERDLAALEAERLRLLAIPPKVELAPSGRPLPSRPDPVVGALALRIRAARGPLEVKRIALDAHREAARILGTETRSDLP